MMTACDDDPSRQLARLERIRQERNTVWGRVQGLDRERNAIITELLDQQVTDALTVAKATGLSPTAVRKIRSKQPRPEMRRNA